MKPALDQDVYWERKFSGSPLCRLVRWHKRFIRQTRRMGQMLEKVKSPSVEKALRETRAVLWYRAGQLLLEFSRRGIEVTHVQRG